MFRSNFLRSSGIFTAAAALALKKKAHVRCALDSTQLTVMPRDDFHSFCIASSSVKKEQMSLDEAMSFLDTLTHAGVVLQHNGYVYLRPKRVLDEVLTTLQLEPFNTEHPEEHALRDECAQRLGKNMEKLRVVARQSALRRRRFWAGVALASGLQMLGLSYLTFIVYGWDTMEPICYFITASTAFASYLYFVVKSKDHTYNSVDTDVLFTENGGGGNDSSLKLHATTVAELVQQASVERVVEEAHEGLIRDLLKDVDGTRSTMKSYRSFESRVE